MPYVYTSPWQDAANLGSGIGDRLAQALIDLPLKRAAVAQQLLQQKISLAQGQQRVGLEKDRLGLEKDRVENQKTYQEGMLKHQEGMLKHYQTSDELMKEKHASEYMQNVVKSTKEDRRFNQTVAHDHATEANAAERTKAITKGQELAEQHRQDVAKVEQSNPLFNGKSPKQMMAMKPEDIKMMGPDVESAWKDYYSHIITQKAREQQNGDGNVNIPTREIPPKSMGSALSSTNQEVKPQARVSSDLERDALPPGTQYIDPQGNVRVKQGGGEQTQGMATALQKPNIQQNIPVTWQPGAYAKYKQQLDAQYKQQQDAQAKQRQARSAQAKQQQDAQEKQQQDARAKQRQDAQEKQRQDARAKQSDIDSQHQARSDQTIQHNEEFDRVADALRYGGPNDEDVIRYLSQFTPQQRAVQIQALQQRAQEMYNKSEVR